MPAPSDGKEAVDRQSITLVGLPEPAPPFSAGTGQMLKGPSKRQRNKAAESFHTPPAPGGTHVHG
jgi:hypothetical protein